MSKLTHTDLVDLGEQLGYLINSPGLCRGFSGVLAQILMSKDKESRRRNLQRFWGRLDFIAQYQGNFHSLISDIEDAKTKIREQVIAKKEDKELRDPVKLDEETESFLEIIAFFDAIELYQNPFPHKDVFGRVTRQSDIEAIYPLARSLEQEETD